MKVTSATALGAMLVVVLCTAAGCPAAPNPAPTGPFTNPAPTLMHSGGPTAVGSVNG